MRRASSCNRVRETRPGVSIALSQDKRLIATAGGELSAAYIWQVETGRLLCTLKADLDAESVFMRLSQPSMTFSIDGAMLATANESDISVWDLRLCRLHRRLPKPTVDGLEITGLLTLPDRQVLASDEGGTLYKSDVFGSAASMRVVPRAPHRSDLIYGQTGDGRWVLTSGADDADRISPFAPRKLRMVDVQTGAVDTLADYRGFQASASVGMAQMAPRSAAVSRSGRWVIESHLGLATLYDRQNRVVAGRVQGFGFDPDFAVRGARPPGRRNVWTPWAT